MNVALTRAKSSLFVLGHAPTLERSDDTWRDIVRDARTRNCLVDVIGHSLLTSSTSLTLLSAGRCCVLHFTGGADEVNVITHQAG